MSDFQIQYRGKDAGEDRWYGWYDSRHNLPYIVAALADGAEKVTIIYDDKSRTQYRRKK